MSKASAHRKFLTPAAQDAIKRLGGHVRTARKRRRLSQADLAERSCIGIATLQRLERGQSVSIDILANVLVALNLEGTLLQVANPDQDEAGKEMEALRLPKRIRESRKDGLDTDF